MPTGATYVCTQRGSMYTHMRVDRISNRSICMSGQLDKEIWHTCMIHACTIHVVQMESKNVQKLSLTGYHVALMLLVRAAQTTHSTVRAAVHRRSFLLASRNKPIEQVKIGCPHVLPLPAVGPAARNHACPGNNNRCAVINDEGCSRAETDVVN